MKKAFFSVFLICLLLLSVQAYADLSSNLQVVRETAPVTKKVISETYVDAQGKPAVASDKGYATITYKYNHMNMVTEKRFLDADGDTVNCLDGYTCIQYEYYMRKTIRTAYLNAEGKYVLGPEGYAVREIKHGERGIEKEAFEYDADGNVLLHVITEYVDEKHNNLVKSKAWYDANDQLIAGPDGYARVFYEYRNKQVIHVAYYNPDGSLSFNEKDGFAEVEKIYEKGKLTEVVYRQGMGELAAGPDGYARVTYTYSKDGKETQIMYYNADGSPFYTNEGYCGLRQYQKNNQSMDESYYVAEGVRGNCIYGYSRTVIRYNLFKQITSQSFYDNQDQLVCPEGQVYAKIKNAYKGQYLIKTEYFGADEKPVIGPDGYAVAVYKYAQKRKTEEDYYAEDGKTRINCNAGYARVVYQYDNTRQRQCISEAYYDTEGNRKAINGEADELRFGWNSSRQKISESYWKDGQPANGEKGYHEIRTEYNGKKIKSQSYYDFEGNRTLCKDGYAGTEKLYNSQGRDMATLYYDEQWKLTNAPGKEYAYVLTIPEKDKKVLAEETAEEENKEAEETEEQTEGENEENIPSGTVYVEYYGTDRKLLNLSSGYAYIIRKTDEQGRVIREQYFDNEGNKAVLKNGYDEIRQYYTEGKKPYRIEYYLNGVPALYADNYAALEREYDEAGNTVVECYYDTVFQPAPCKNGYEMIRKAYDEEKRVIREEYYDHLGQPMINNKGVYQKTNEYNEFGKVAREAYFDTDGKPMACPDGYAALERMYNEQGDTIATLYFNEADELILTPGREYAYSVTTPREDLAEGDEDSGKTVYIEYYGTDRQMMTLSAGYAAVLRQTDERGRTIREICFDLDGNRVIQKSEYDEIRQTYGEGNKPNRIEYYLNGAPVLRKDGYAAVEREYDEAGNIIVEKYFDASLQAAPCNNGYEMIRKEYNDDKKVIKEAYFDHNGQPMINKKGVYQNAYEYNENGKVSKEFYFDSEGKPMRCPDGYAGLERLYNSQGGTIATLYYDQAGELMLAPGKEYAYQMTIPKEEKDGAAEEDENIKAVYLEYYGTDRKLMTISSGYAAVLRRTDEQGRTVGEVYFDQDGQRTVRNNTFDEVRNFYTGDRKVPCRMEYYKENEPVMRSEGYAAIEREYDEAGNVILEKYYDTDFNPTKRNEYEMIRREYNGEKRVVKEAYFTNAGEPMVNNRQVYMTTFEYNEQGKVIREAYFDTDGQPMANSNGYIKIERTYNEEGKKITETSYTAESLE